MIPAVLIPVLGELISLVPNITRMITGSAKAGEVAESVVDLAKKITGKESDSDALAELKANPELVTKYRLALLDLEAELSRQETDRLKAVNETMRAESASDHWPTYSWRPFIGFSFGAYVCSLWLLPLFGKAPVILNPDLTIAIGAILGVASWYRGKMQADPAVKSDMKG